MRNKDILLPVSYTHLDVYKRQNPATEKYTITMEKLSTKYTYLPYCIDPYSICLLYTSGAVMCNLFLADEINRTSPKTQSALLEVMEEGNVTVDGISRKVPEPFIVMATQNPKGSAGTQLVPESQLCLLYTSRCV